MSDDRLTPISRAMARMLAEKRHSPAFNKWKRKFERLQQAVKAEEAAGVRYGPAEHELHWFITSNLAVREVLGNPANLFPNPGAPGGMRCYYCEGPTETKGRLCIACKQYIQAIFDGKIPERFRYKRTITPYMRGDHLVGVWSDAALRKSGLGPYYRGERIDYPEAKSRSAEKKADERPV